MASQSFRPGLTPLEDRTVASVTPEQLAGAIAQTNAAQLHLDQLIEKQVQNFNVFMVADLKTSLRKVTTDSLESARVLAEYQNDVNVLAQSDSSLGGLVGRIADLRYTAGVNAVYAMRLTGSVGGVPVTGVAATAERASGNWASTVETVIANATTFRQRVVPTPSPTRPGHPGHRAPFLKGPAKAGL